MKMFELAISEKRLDFVLPASGRVPAARCSAEAVTRYLLDCVRREEEAGRAPFDNCQFAYFLTEAAARNFIAAAQKQARPRDRYNIIFAELAPVDIDGEEVNPIGPGERFIIARGDSAFIEV